MNPGFKSLNSDPRILLILFFLIFSFFFDHPLNLLILVVYNESMGLRIFLYFVPFFVFGSLSVNTNARNLCVLNANTGKVISQKRIHEKIYPGSVTKVATALYLIEECEFDEEQVVVCMKDLLISTTGEKKEESNYTLPPYILEKDGTTIYLKANERMRIVDLFHAMIMRSANDASNVLASSYADSISDFMIRMNQYLRKIGCKNTHFINPHGLHHPDHYTTAYDLALIMKAATMHPYLKKVMSTTEYTIPRTNLASKREVSWFSHLIKPNSRYYVPSVVCAKTGYHKRAKYNILLFAEDKGRSVVMVVNQADTKVHLLNDCRKVLSVVFDEKPKERLLFNSEESKFYHRYDWGSKMLTASLKEDCLLKYFPSEEEPIDVKIHWLDKKTPVKLGDVVGTLDVYNQAGVPLMQQEIYAENEVGIKVVKKLAAGMNHFIAFFANYPYFTIIMLLAVGIFLSSRRRKKVV